MISFVLNECRIQVIWYRILARSDFRDLPNGKWITVNGFRHRGRK